MPSRLVIADHSPSSPTPSLLPRRMDQELAKRAKEAEDLAVMLGTRAALNAPPPPPQPLGADGGGRGGGSLGAAGTWRNMSPLAVAAVPAVSLFRCNF